VSSVYVLFQERQEEAPSVRAVRIRQSGDRKTGLARSDKRHFRRSERLIRTPARTNEACQKSS